MLQGSRSPKFGAEIRPHSQSQKVCFFPNSRWKIPNLAKCVWFRKISGVVIKYIKKPFKTKKVSIRCRFLYQKVFKISASNNWIASIFLPTRSSVTGIGYQLLCKRYCEIHFRFQWRANHNNTSNNRRANIVVANKILIWTKSKTSSAKIWSVFS